MASGFNIPIVGLYGASFPECCGPFWGDKAKHVILSADFSSRKPSFATKERTKRVNSIFPDEIAHGILSLLNLDPQPAETNPVHLGKSFHRVIVDIVPDFETTDNFPVSRTSPVNIRMDYIAPEEYTGRWLEHYKCVVHTNKREDIQRITNARPNISKLYVYLSDEHTDKDLEALAKLAIPMQLYYPHKDTIPDIRVKFFGHNIHLDEEGSKKDLDFSSEICDTSCYKSSLNLYSNNKLYPCKAALDLGIEKKEEQFIINNPAFYKEIEFFKIYNHAKKKDSN